MPDHVVSSGGGHFPDGVAVVIGGSGGIGAAICERLADHGADVALTYRANGAAAAGVVTAVERAGRRGLAEAVDVGDEEQVAGFFDRVAGSLGRPHTVVYAVGASIELSWIAEVTPEAWQEVVAADLTGFFNTVRAALPHLRAGGGSIVAITTAGLERHPPRDILSTVPKAGIEALVRGVAREEGRHGIRANSVALGVLDTGHFHRVRETLGEEFVEAMRRNTALRRFGTAREAADAVVFLASSASAFTTGQRLVVDGGFSV